MHYTVQPLELLAENSRGNLAHTKFTTTEGLCGEVSHLVAEVSNCAAVVINKGFFEYFLADKIVDFHERFPQVNIDLTEDFTPDTITKLKEDKCDVAFVNLPIETDADLKLYGNCMLLNDTFVTGGKFADLAEEKLTLAELKKYPLIFMDKNTVARRSLDAFLQSIGVSLQPAIEVGSWDLMKRLVTSGMGVGVIPREYATRRLQDGELFEVKTDTPLPARSVGMLLPKDIIVW